MNDPIELFLVAGFFGSGKTTLLQNILTQTQDVRAGVIVNEFGRISIDGRLLERNGLNMVEINNGSIFCACLKAKFVDALIEFSRHPIDVLFVENSGFADPSQMGELLDSLPLERPYRYTGAVTVVDCTTFLRMRQLMPVADHQVAAANRILLNKADLVSPSELMEVRQAVFQLNPRAKIFETSYAQVDWAQLRQAPAGENSGRECLNTVSSRPVSLILRGECGVVFCREELLVFANAVGPSLFRLKGFAPTPEGWVEVEYSGNRAEIRPGSPQQCPEGLMLVLIGADRSILPVLAAAAQEQFHGRVRLSVSGALPAKNSVPVANFQPKTLDAASRAKVRRP